MMTDSPATRRRPEGSTLTLRLRALAYERYAELLLEQIDALDRDDLETFQRIALDREHLAARVDGLEDATRDHAAPTVYADPPTAGEYSEPAAVLGERISEALRRCAEGNARMYVRLQELRNEALAGVRGVARTRGAVRAYAGAGPDRGSLEIDL